MEESVPGIKASQQRFEAYDEESRGTCHSVLSAMAESEKGKLHESLGYGPTDFDNHDDDDEPGEWEDWPSRVEVNEFPEG